MTNDTQIQPSSATGSASQETAPTGSGPGRQNERAMPVELLEQIYKTLRWYANRYSYQAPRTGGVMEGCPRGKWPDIDDLVAPALELLPKMEQAFRNPTGPTTTGTALWFNAAKGFGFIRPDEGEDIFAHFSQIPGGDMREGQRVRFGVSRGPKGRQATNIEFIPVSTPTANPADGEGGASALTKLT